MKKILIASLSPNVALGCLNFVTAVSPPAGTREFFSKSDSSSLASCQTNPATTRRLSTNRILTNFTNTHHCDFRKPNHFHSQIHIKKLCLYFSSQTVLHPISSQFQFGTFQSKIHPVSGKTRWGNIEVEVGWGKQGGWGRGSNRLLSLEKDSILKH